MPNSGLFAIIFSKMSNATLKQWELEPTASKTAVFGQGWGRATWKTAKPVLVKKLEEQGGTVVSSALCYRVLTVTRARIWVKYQYFFWKIGI